MALTFLPATAFRAELEQRVEDHFRDTGLTRRDVPAMYVKTAVMLTWLTGSYVALVFYASSAWQAIALALSLGLAKAGIGFCVQHDGGHGAYSQRRWVNRIMALSLDLLGGSAYFWHYKHNIAHHSFPNVSGADDDINAGPLARLSPHVRRRTLHRFQHLYVWVLYALLAVEWQISGDLRQYIKPGMATTRVPRPRGWDHLTFWCSRLLFLTLAFGLPMLFHPVANVLALYLLSSVVLGLALGIVFQLAHCVGEAAFRQPKIWGGSIEREWAAHQVETTVNFAPANRWLCWYLGGLNFQIEHHLFPKICHVHYPALAPIVREVCSKRGVTYTSHPTFTSALRSHVRWLKQLGAA